MFLIFDILIKEFLFCKCVCGFVIFVRYRVVVLGVMRNGERFSRGRF